MSLLEIGQHHKGRVEKLVYGGAGLLRNNGIVIFVLDVLPEEEITYEITSVKKRYAEGRLISIEHASPNRIKPRCPHFGVCGGCQLQHAHASCHAEIKNQWLKESMYGLLPEGISPIVVPATDVWAWRRKITLHARPGPVLGLGYFSRDNTTLLSIRECPIFFRAGEETLLELLRNALQCIKSPFFDITVSLFRLEDSSLYIAIKSPHNISSSEQTLLIEKMHELTTTFSLSFASWNVHVGSHDFSLHILGKEWFFSLDAFIQNNAAQSERLWKDMLQLLDNEEKTNIFDLYSGVGVTAIELASQGHTVCAVEASRDAVKAARRTATSRGISAKFVCGKVEETIPRLPFQASIWVVNPPRTGLSPQARDLLCKSKPRHVIYISCSPATMARDIKECKKENYQVQWIRGYDMFPQTTHLETVALLEQTSD